MEGRGLTPGIRNAISRGNVHSMCTDCGFPLPKYPGRYPKACPSCGTERTSGDEPSESVDVGDRLNGGTVVEIDEEVAYVEQPDGEIEAVYL